MQIYLICISELGRSSFLFFFFFLFLFSFSISLPPTAPSAVVPGVECIKFDLFPLRYQRNSASGFSILFWCFFLLLFGVFFCNERNRASSLIENQDLKYFSLIESNCNSYSRGIDEHDPITMLDLLLRRPLIGEADCSQSGAEFDSISSQKNFHWLVLGQRTTGDQSDETNRRERRFKRVKHSIKTKKMARHKNRWFFFVIRMVTTTTTTTTTTKEIKEINLRRPLKEENFGFGRKQKPNHVL